MVEEVQYGGWGRKRWLVWLKEYMLGNARVVDGAEEIWRDIQMAVCMESVNWGLASYRTRFILK